MPEHRTVVPPSDALLDLATRAAKRAGDHALKMAGEALSIETKSSANDFVTQVDEECERLIVDSLLAERPHDGLAGEEGAATDGTTGVMWHIDPIDGTTNYVYGQPGWAVSIAAAVGGPEGHMVVGVVFDPRHEELFTAVHGAGAWCNGVAIAPRSGDRLASAVIATGFSYDADIRRHQAAVLADVLPAVGNIRRCGSAAVDLCWVGLGRVDAYYESGLNLWDRAAGGLIAAEAGALVHDLHHREPTRRFTFAASPAIHDQLRDVLVAAGADRIEIAE